MGHAVESLGKIKEYDVRLSLTVQRLSPVVSGGEQLGLRGPASPETVLVIGQYTAILKMAHDRGTDDMLIDLTDH